MKEVITKNNIEIALKNRIKGINIYLELIINVIIETDKNVIVKSW